MPSVRNLVQDNRILRNRLKASLDNRKYPIDGQLWPLVYLGVKLLRHDEALEILADRGFGSEAGMILRTMFEAAVNIMWITKDIEKDGELVAKLERYTAYQFVVSQKYRDYATNSEALKQIPEAAREEWKKNSDILNEKAIEVKDEYGFNPYKPWSGKTLKAMANDVGWGERYDTLYQIYSDVVHSGIMSVQEYLVFDKDGKVTVNYRVQTEHCKTGLQEGKNYLLTAFGFLNIFLGLNLDKIIDENLPNREHKFHIT